jgi:hypothetical protein
MICDLLTDILPTLGKDQGDPFEDLIRSMHAHAEQLVKDFVGSKVEQDTYTEILPPYSPTAAADLASESPALFFPTPGALQLRNTPVRSVVSVHETTTPGGGGWPAAALLGPLDFWLDQEEDGLSRSGLLYRSAGVWPAIGRNIRVQYVGGWTADEITGGEAMTFKLAVKQATTKFFREAEAHLDNASGGPGVGPLVSEGIMGWSQAFHAESVAQLTGMQTDLPASVKAMLQPFVNYGARMGRLR